MKAVNGLKICSKCKREKAVSEYANNRAAIDGLQPQCKRCHGETVRRYLKARYRADEAYRQKKIAAATRRARLRPQLRRAYESSEKVRQRDSQRGKASREELSETYIKQRLRADFGIEKIPQELIEMKREHLRLKRAIQERKT